MGKYDKEFYTDLEVAFERWKQLNGKAKNVHLIKADSSGYYLVVWEKH